MKPAFGHTLAALLLLATPLCAQQQYPSNVPPQNATCPQPDSTDLADITSLRIGVRRHARPFSYYSENLREVWSAAPQAPLALHNYTGYMSKICDAVLADMQVTRPADSTSFGYSDVKVVDVDCLIQEDERNGTPKPSRLEYLGDKIDILCDPATITNARRHGFILSPPLFLSGMGLINRGTASIGNANCPAKPLIGYVRNTTAALSGIPKVLLANELKSYAELLRAYVRDQTNSCSTALSTSVVVQSYETHEKAAKAFCNDEFYYYIGDREIITYNARNVPGCGAEIEGAGQTYSNDRYAIYGKISHREGAEIRDLRIARFFEILSQKIVVSPSLLDTAYENTFFEEPSRKLEAFYWNIRGPRRP
ncbi:substrate-binding periplasmic protein [Sedimentitalea todarodis]|uniref:Transporter substrate-binding domain-containing protein n=1 Tax=Sedimentitalea todarodis TaxID=1631240 RepID=A0ABU3VBJ8_9RHOB|nr:transporter substrate-binding domain-containing protein [Sedimentitalea todarodis]MDU9003448.1 transporter substrate-binding domain-containing protein [Sedimentitalea todarodis]